MDRFTISLDDALAADFDAWVARRGYTARSEAVRDLIRDALARHRAEQAASGPCVAALTYVYNHHERDLAERITSLQHDHHDTVMATMHAHLDHAHCIEAVLLKGSVTQVRALSDAICHQRGVSHGQLNVVPTRRSQRHSHDAGGGHPHTHLSPRT